ncbi:putative C2 domain, protein BONZAI [Rosa chinensis]|uniref:Putative C2 domain, protein BONZAI n=1 Tax=Rosa chinensis TaxID=74649 RepID=A0A2P6RUB6_ROSCH|nr:putative C2 domain, protein BONZAI [Rosa chinensis]
MGGCFSDVRGGKQAVGGAQQRPINYHEDCNDAVDCFNKSQGAVPLFTPLELSFSASNLLDRDFTSKSDPMVKVRVAYHFEFVQPLLFRVYDVDTKYHNVNVKTLDLKNQEFLGEGTCALSEIVTKQSRSLTLNLNDDYGRLGGRRNLGTLTVHAEEFSASKSVVEIKFRCSRLENKDLFSKSDPFLRISRMVETGGCVPICKTEVVDNNLNPTWKSLCLSMQQIGSKDNPLVIECFDFNSNGEHVLIGKLQKSVADLEKLYKEKSSVNFVIPPSSRHGHEKLSKVV